MKAIILVFLLSLVFGQVIRTNLGCKKINPDGSCDTCSDRYYKDSEGICQPVSTSCRTYNTKNGDCTGCYGGYILVNVVCVRDPTPKDQFCANFQDGLCVKCSKGYYLKDQKCTLINVLCKNFDESKEECTECYNGFELQADKSCKVKNVANLMPGCKNFSTSGVCVACALDYYLNSDNVCVKLSENCKEFENKANGDCKECFPGYTLENKKCVKADLQTLNLGLDANCHKFEGRTCVACAKGFIFDNNKKCIALDPLCKKYNKDTLRCEQCYVGFELKDNKCEYDITKPSFDVNCKQFDSNGKCVACALGFWWNNGDQKCKSIGDNCKAFDVQEQKCIECYNGYTIVNLVCEKVNTEVQEATQGATAAVVVVDNAVNKVEDKIEEKKNETKNVVENIENKVEEVKQDAKAAVVTVDDNSSQQSDAKSEQSSSNTAAGATAGNSASNNAGNSGTSSSNAGNSGSSSSSSNTRVIMPAALQNCAQIVGNTCAKCAERAYYNADGNCVRVSDQCNRYNAFNGKCLTCYAGYALDSASGECKPSQGAACLKRNDQGQCAECVKRYYLDANKNCQQVDDHCKDFDYDKKKCTGCYEGFNLNDQNKCVLAPVVSPQQTPNVKNCAKYNVNTNLCSECFKLFYLKDNQCHEADPLCKQFDKNTGACTSCFSGGFRLVEGKCVLA